MKILTQRGEKSYTSTDKKNLDLIILNGAFILGEYSSGSSCFQPVEKGHLSPNPLCPSPE